MLTDEYRRLPSLPPPISEGLQFPFFVVVVSFQLGPPLTVTPFRVETVKKQGSLTSPKRPNAIITSRKV